MLAIAVVKIVTGPGVASSDGLCRRLAWARIKEQGLVDHLLHVLSCGKILRMRASEAHISDRTLCDYPEVGVGSGGVREMGWEKIRVLGWLVAAGVCAPLLGI